MKRKYPIIFLLLFIFNDIYFTTYAQDTVVHAVTDPEMTHYYGSHWFWVLVSLAVLILLGYSGRRRRRKKLPPGKDDL
jgi:cell division protein FtsW (lipid II flippase)